MTVRDTFERILSMRKIKQFLIFHLLLSDGCDRKNRWKIFSILPFISQLESMSKVMEFEKRSSINTIKSSPISLTTGQH